MAPGCVQNPQPVPLCTGKEFLKNARPLGRGRGRFCSTNHFERGQTSPRIVFHRNGFKNEIKAAVCCHFVRATNAAIGEDISDFARRLPVLPCKLLMTTRAVSFSADNPRHKRHHTKT